MCGFQYSLTGYGTLLEAGVPSWRMGVKNFKDITQLLGPERVRWRYDPILLGKGFDRDFHLKNFSTLAARLEGHTRICHISFVQFYKKTIQRFAGLEERAGLILIDPEEDEKICLARELLSIAASRILKSFSFEYL